MKKAKPKPPVFRLTRPARFNFTAKDLVDLFLNTTEYWYSSKDNALYGKRARVRAVLMAYLTKNQDVAKDNSEIYALNKFQREWLSDDGSETLFAATSLPLAEKT